MIGDALPRAKSKLELYGTESMLLAVALLYAQIMRFSQRAIKWYSESKLKHIYHSITQASEHPLLCASSLSREDVWKSLANYLIALLLVLQRHCR